MIYTEELWHGYRRLNFKFEDREAIMVLPEKPCAERKWMLKTEYFGAFPGFEIEMLGQGFHLAYVKNITRWHSPEDDDVRARFCDFVSAEFHLAKKCMTVGMSCGGMLSVYFAAKYPRYVGAMYLDAPVMNFLSCPGGVGASTATLFEEFFRHTGKTLADLINYRNHPIDNLWPILENRIPVFMVSGDSDTTVPYEENGAHMVAYLRARGGDVTEIIKEGCAHHPHGLTDNAPLIAFAQQKYKTN